MEREARNGRTDGSPDDRLRTRWSRVRTFFLIYGASLALTVLAALGWRAVIGWLLS